MRGFRWPKACRCGEAWAREAWAKLILVGHTEAPDEGEIELRNCTCGSTLAVPRDATRTKAP